MLTGKFLRGVLLPIQARRTLVNSTLTFIQSLLIIMAKKDVSHFTFRSDGEEEEESKHSKRTPDDNLAKKSQQSLLSNFFG
jgi:hypothetical protein